MNVTIKANSRYEFDNKAVLGSGSRLFNAGQPSLTWMVARCQWVEGCNSKEWPNWMADPIEANVINPTKGPGSDQRARVLQVPVHDCVSRAQGEGQNGECGMAARIMGK